MKASEALVITENAKPNHDEEQYNRIMVDVKLAALDGKTEAMLIKEPSPNVVKKLEEDGYVLIRSKPFWFLGISEIFYIKWG